MDLKPCKRIQTSVYGFRLPVNGCYLIETLASTVLRLSWVDESSVVNGKISITLEHAAGCNILQALAWLGQSVESLTVERKVTDSIPGKRGRKTRWMHS